MFLKSGDSILAGKVTRAQITVTIVKWKFPHLCGKRPMPGSGRHYPP
jgi:hypothetical protein